MKKRIPSFFAGALTMALVLTLTTTALAASGQITYNFSSIALNGETKIAAGTTVTAENGQEVPSSILYVDEAGGKTNYLPIRAISDLLGVEIGYDSASKTVLLGEQPAAQPAAADRRWQQTWKDGRAVYTAGADERVSGSALSAWQLTAVPEGWKLVEADILEDGEGCSWTYRKGTDILTFSCDAFSSGGSIYLPPAADAAGIDQEAAVNGAPAEFYQYEDRAILVWETAAGVLCQLEGPLSRTELETIAATAAEVKTGALPVYQLDWVPEGSTNRSRSALRTAVCETWAAADGGTFRWMYAAASAGTLAEPDGTPELLTVNGVQAKYWAGDPDAEGGVTISVGVGDSIGQVLEYPSESQQSTLMWTDTATGITFRIRGRMDRDTLLRIAENIK